MGKLLEIRVPDIGDFEDVEVVEILVAKDDEISIDDPLVSIESDKATMEIPSTAAGVVAEVRVAEGDRVSEGSVLVVLEVAAAEAGAEEADAADAPASEAEGTTSGPELAAGDAPAEAESRRDDPAGSASSGAGSEGEAEASTEVGSDRPRTREMSLAAANPVPDRTGLPHASPLVRRYARELGVPIGATEGSGPSGRILVEDLKRHVRERFAADAAPAASAGGSGTMGVPPIPFVDPATFGPVHERPLTRIQKVSGPGLHRSWLNVPHVTQHDEADLTELERFRRDRREAAAEQGVRLSPLLFVMKAVVLALRAHPALRASLAPEGDRLLVKDYYHLGIAVDTDQGLVVPVIRDVDRKGVFELARELAETAERARARKLAPDDLKGACFTISSLGGIGGTAFTPIVNAPEVAILGLSKTRVQPVWRGPSPIDPPADEVGGGGRFEPRIVLPLSLSYDHRVIDGAEAVRFTSRLSRVLSDPMQLLL
ncbi:MAG: 2-oxo acid dehydrogenase subunit E2 [Myxococcales bacterium]|nr:2-oxo acid dehydrogenase subunit E2 [Myxococcales bacterium]